MATGAQFAEKALTALTGRWGYIFGTSGQVWTAADQTQIESTKQNDSNYTLSIKYGRKWIGSKVADCSGLVLWCSRQFGFTVPHGSNSIWKGYLKESGSIQGELPVGALVFKLRNGIDYYHVGIYIGDNQVVEAQGSNKGVVKSSLSAWTHYGLLKSVAYAAAPQIKEKEPAEMKGSAVVDVSKGSTVNVRAAPSKSAKLLTTLPKGATVEVVRDDGQWCLVSFAESGYIMTEYLKEVQQ